jgi:hypothetical protein
MENTISLNNQYCNICDTYDHFQENCDLNRIINQELLHTNFNTIDPFGHLFQMFNNNNQNDNIYNNLNEDSTNNTNDINSNEDTTDNTNDINLNEDITNNTNDINEDIHNNLNRDTTNNTNEINDINDINEDIHNNLNRNTTNNLNNNLNENNGNINMIFSQLNDIFNNTNNDNRYIHSNIENHNEYLNNDDLETVLNASFNHSQPYVKNVNDFSPHVPVYNQHICPVCQKYVYLFDVYLDSEFICNICKESSLECTDMKKCFTLCGHSICKECWIQLDENK